MRDLAGGNLPCLAHRVEEGVPGRVQIEMSSVMFYIAHDATGNLECD